ASARGGSWIMSLLLAKDVAAVCRTRISHAAAQIWIGYACSRPPAAVRPVVRDAGHGWMPISRCFEDCCPLMICNRMGFLPDVLKSDLQSDGPLFCLICRWGCCPVDSADGLPSITS
ncbi:hypothetical protein ACLOJK_029410, partial [Asimina triloba]